MTQPWRLLTQGLLVLFCGVRLNSPLQAAEGPDHTPPVILNVLPVPGLVKDVMTSITVTFSEPVANVDIDDLLINGLPVVGVSGADDTYTFTVLQPTYGPVHLSWSPGHGILDLSIPPQPFDANGAGATWDYDFVDTQGPSVVRLFPAPGAQLRSMTDLEVDFSESVQGVDASDLLINGTPALGLEELPNGRYIFHFTSPVPGNVRFTWSTQNGITDRAATPHAFVGTPWDVTLDPTSTPANLVITEILAANENGLGDEDSTKIDPQPQDWIEIHNRGNAAVNLAGWSLSDEVGAPGLWVFPDKIIPAGGYLVVFASGKNRTNTVGNALLHTNFRLSPRGEFLGLFSPDSPRQLMDSVGNEYPQQRPDISYGRDEQGQWRYYTQPSPGKPNSGPTISGACAEVHFSAPRGHYNNPVLLYLSTDTPGAFIRYTTDGSEPSPNNGTTFSSPISIAKNAIVRAVAFRDDLLPSKVGTHTYLYRQNAAVRSLPILSIATATKNLTGPTGIIGIGTGYQNPNEHGIAWERPTSVEYILSKDNSGFQVDCGIRVQGSDYTRPRYTADSKFSYRLYFRGDYGSGRLEYPFFADSPLKSFDQIVLRAGHNDETNPFLLDEMVRQLSKDEGQVACHGTFVNLFINGVFKGYYNPTERVEESFLQAYHGGSDSWDVITVNSTVQGGDGVAWNSLLNMVARTNVSLPAAYQEIARRVDLTNFVDYLFVNVYAATWDWPHNNWRSARNRDANGPFRFYVWDAEGGFLSSRGPSFDSLTSSDSGLGSSAEIPNLFNKLRTSPEFRLLFADRVHKHFYNGGALVESNVLSRFIQLRDPLLPSIAGFDNSIQSSWVPQRRRFLTTQLNNQRLIASTNAPVLNQFGGSVPRGFELTMKTFATNGVIYYTLNGVDPRVMFSNTVAQTALTYSNPIVITEPILLQARTLAGTNWSALTTTTFQIDTLSSPLRITEIMYNPVGGSPYEYIEILNTSSAPLDMTGVSFVGVNYFFPDGTIMPAGARWLFTSDTDTNAFAQRYPGVTIKGSFGGNLSNGGERIALLDKAGNVIVAVDYLDRYPWPAEADGSGRSLELIDPNGDPYSPASWRASVDPQGSPGREAAVAPEPIVQITEVMAENIDAIEHETTHPDWIELYNPGSQTIQLGGWSLSDDANIRKYVFPAVAEISAGGYLVVYCDDPSPRTSGYHTGFALKRAGDQIFLYDVAGNRVDGVSFGHQVADSTLGKFEGVWTLTRPTPGAANIAATLGSRTQLTFNEWQIAPSPGSSPWFELFNRSETDVIALQGTYLGTSNTLQRFQSLTFLAPQEHLQIFADSLSGTDHIPLTLTPRTGHLVLVDSDGTEIQRVKYAAQTNQVSQGFLPDGSTNLVSFPGSSSPGLPNYVLRTGQITLSEILANPTQGTAWIEVANTNSTSVNWGGYFIRVQSSGTWEVPAGLQLPPGSTLQILFDPAHVPTTTLQGPFHSGLALGTRGDVVEILNPAGQLVERLVYGAQLQGVSVGKLGSAWRLLSSPTPGDSNSDPAALGSPVALRVNEWLAEGFNGEDWFEVFNTTNLPVNMGGLYLSDDPSAAYTNLFRVPDLSFVPAQGWLVWEADGNIAATPGHVNFRIDPQGESLRIYNTNGTVIDALDFGPQTVGVSTGRLPDGSTNLFAFVGTASPGAANYLQSTDVVISEVLISPNAGLFQDQAIEIQNRSSAPVDLTGWMLNTRLSSTGAYVIPAGSLLPPKGFIVFYPSLWSAANTPSWKEAARHGGEVWLIDPSVTGQENGQVDVARFGPSQPGQSWGLVADSAGSRFLPLEATTFGVSSPQSVAEFRTGKGALNASPRVGPIIVSEIMYHPSDNATPSVEFIELQNISNAAIRLYDQTSVDQTWRIEGGVSFQFPGGVTLQAGARLLVVDFDPVTQSSRAASFRSTAGVPAQVPLYGPWSGRLSNDSENIQLMQPVPAIGTDNAPSWSTADEAHYTSKAPWPVGLANGEGHSLQRRIPANLGNSPTSWQVSAPTPGKENGSPAQVLPIIVDSPRNTTNMLGTSALFGVVASGPGPLRYQWLHNGRSVTGATNALFILDPLRQENEGHYQVAVGNGGGVVISSEASLDIQKPLLILEPPLSQFVKGNVNSNITLRVLAVGDAPLSYQWSFNGMEIPGANGSTLTLTRISAPQDGLYTVRVTNPIAQKTASALVSVIFAPSISLQPQPLILLAGDTLNINAAAGGSTPLSFRWRRNGSTVVTLASSNGFNTYSVTNAKTTAAGNYSVVITNLAGAVTSIVANVQVLTDTDKDRLPDTWETANGFNPNLATDAAGDVDKDGVPNIDEFLSGTDPRNASDFLKISRITAEGSQARVTFMALSNRTYSVIYKDDVGAERWSILGQVFAQPTNRLENVLDSTATNRSRVYRLLTPMSLP